MSLALLFALPALPARQQSVHVDGSPAAAAPWLDRFNLWRSSTGVPLLTENPTWSTGDYDHALYMVKNNLVTHYETAGTPYYTTDGDAAARNGNIFVSSTTATTDEQAIDWWMGAPFHAMGMMDPRLTQTGFGSYREVKTGWDMGAAVDVLRGNPFTGGTWPVFFPGNGSTEPLTTYSGNESPDPLQACPGYASPTGLPIFVELGGNVTTKVTASSITANGVSLAHCAIDSSNPAVGSNLTYRGGVILIPQAPLVTGVKYTVQATVNGTSYTWSFTVGPFNQHPCTGATLTSDKASPQTLGGTITFTATATGCPNPLFQYYMQPPGGVWSVVQPYSPVATFVWNTAGKAAGDYHFSMWVRDASSLGTSGTLPNTYDAFVPMPYTLTMPNCSSMTATPSPASPSASGTAVTITATASGCPSPQFEFWLLPPGGGWTLARPYSATATYSWSTAGLVNGGYRWSVWARDANSTGSAGTSPNTYDSFNTFNYSLGTSPCTAISVSEVPATTATLGNNVTITGAATGCPNPQYRFWVQAPGGAWVMARDYGAASFVWPTAGLAAGTYKLQVWARQSGSTATYETYLAAPIGYALVAAPPCSGVTVTEVPATAAGVGNNVTLTATATGCGAPQYEFWLLAPGGTWTLVRGYSSSATFVWPTAGRVAGTYRFSVWARDANSAGTNGTAPNTYDSFSAFNYSLV